MDVAVEAEGVAVWSKWKPSCSLSQLLPVPLDLALTSQTSSGILLRYSVSLRGFGVVARLLKHAGTTKRLGRPSRARQIEIAYQSDTSDDVLREHHLEAQRRQSKCRRAPESSQKAGRSRTSGLAWRPKVELLGQARFERDAVGVSGRARNLARIQGMCS